MCVVLASLWFFISLRLASALLNRRVEDDDHRCALTQHATQPARLVALEVAR
jgi:hypothetical protein